MEQLTSYKWTSQWEWGLNLKKIMTLAPALVISQLAQTLGILFIFFPGYNLPWIWDERGIWHQHPGMHDEDRSQGKAST